MDNKLSYNKFCNLEEHERTQIVNLSKNKLTVDEKIKFEFASSLGEFITCALDVKLMSQKYCNQDIFESMSESIGKQSIIVEKVYQNCDGVNFRKTKVYDFDSCVDYCNFKVIVDGDLIDEGYIYVDYFMYDKARTKGFLNIATIQNRLGDEEKNDIFFLFSEAIDASIEHIGKPIITNHKKQKEDNLDEWLERMGIADLYKKN